MFCNCFFRLSRPQAPLQKSICNAEDNSLKKKAPGYLGSFTEFILKKVHIEFSASVHHYENCFLIYTVYSSFQHTSSILLLLSFPWSVFGILGTFAFPVFLVCHRIGGYDSLKNAWSALPNIATASAGTARALSSPHTAPNNIPHHTASRCNTLQHTATCSRLTMKHAASLSNISARAARALAARALKSQHTPPRALKTDACKYNTLRVKNECAHSQNM